MGDVAACLLQRGHCVWGGFSCDDNRMLLNPSLCSSFSSSLG